MNFLFVCSMGLYRSPTFASVFRRKGFKARHAGTATGATVPLSKKLVDWADLIVCMEIDHFEAVNKLNPQGPKHIPILHIRDIYDRDDPRLVKIAEEWADIYEPSKTVDKKAPPPHDSDM